MRRKQSRPSFVRMGHPPGCMGTQSTLAFANRVAACDSVRPSDFTSSNCCLGRSLAHSAAIRNILFFRTAMCHITTQPI